MSYVQYPVVFLFCVEQYRLGKALCQEHKDCTCLLLEAEFTNMDHLLLSDNWDTKKQEMFLSHYWAQNYLLLSFQEAIPTVKKCRIKRTYMVFQRFPNSREVFDLISTFYFEWQFLNYWYGLVVAKWSSVISQGFRRWKCDMLKQSTNKREFHAKCAYPYICR